MKRGYSSTCRELAAVARSTTLSGSMLQNKIVKWFTDSAYIVKIINFGSGKTVLQKLARSLYERLSGLNMDVVGLLVWIPRNEKVRASRPDVLALRFGRLVNKRG